MHCSSQAYCMHKLPCSNNVASDVTTSCLNHHCYIWFTALQHQYSTVADYSTTCPTNDPPMPHQCPSNAPPMPLRCPTNDCSRDSIEVMTNKAIVSKIVNRPYFPIAGHWSAVHKSFTFEIYRTFCELHLKQFVISFLPCGGRAEGEKISVWSTVSPFRGQHAHSYSETRTIASQLLWKITVDGVGIRAVRCWFCVRSKRQPHTNK